MQVYLGIGSNLGDRQANMEKALKLLGDTLQLELVSSIYEAEPVGYIEQPVFLNAVCRGQTELGPLQLLSLVKGMEASLGRVSSFPNAPRTIDLDIIFYGHSSWLLVNLAKLEFKIGYCRCTWPRNECNGPTMRFKNDIVNGISEGFGPQ